MPEVISKSSSINALLDETRTGNVNPILSSDIDIQPGVRVEAGRFLTNGEMTSLDTLLRHVGAVYATAKPTNQVYQLERYIWTVLVVLGVGSGVGFGYAFNSNGPLDRLSGVLCCLAVCVLSVTLLAHGRTQSTMGSSAR